MTAKKRARKRVAPKHVDLGCLYTVERDAATGDLVLDWVCDECEAVYNAKGLTARTFLSPEEYSVYEADVAKRG